MGEKEESYCKYRISICKSNGSVCKEEFTEVDSIKEQLEELLLKHPHLLISRQRVVDKNGKS